MHKSAFINIIGLPNVGKSTLLNEIIGEKISIVTHKAQTTRHNILGILNGDDYQLIFCDTPGIIDPKYALQGAMMKAVKQSMEAADIVLAIASLDPKEYKKSTNFILEYCKNISQPLAIVFNKVDTSTEDIVQESTQLISSNINYQRLFVISALHKYNINCLIEFALENSPSHPPYYEKDMYTDKDLRFIAAEKIREQILLHFKQEIPYSVEVIIDEYKEKEDIDHISAKIIVERESQKAIIIGKGGNVLKKIGTNARKNIQNFSKKKVFLEIFVKVMPNWRNNKNFIHSRNYE